MLVRQELSMVLRGQDINVKVHVQSECTLLGC